MNGADKIYEKVFVLLNYYNKQFIKITLQVINMIDADNHITNLRRVSNNLRRN